MTNPKNINVPGQAASAGVAPERVVFVQAPEFSVVTRAGSPAPERIGKPIENLDRFTSLQTIQKSDLEGWIQRLRVANIGANRRSSPDLLGQLIAAQARQVKVVLCNLLDSDPTACLSAALARQFSQDVAAGAMLISRLVGASQTIFCVDQRLPANWWNEIRARAGNAPARLLTMANDYPQADPTLLLYTVLNRRLKPGGLPTEQNAVVLDGAAALAIGRYFLADEAMTYTPLAVRDHARKLSHFAFAPIGMTLGDLLRSLGQSDSQTLIRGGDLLREILLTPETTIGPGELVVHTSDSEPDINPEACIRCGWCIEACPTRVQPAVILEAAQRDDLDMAERAGIEACIECGICSYVCPSKLPLLDGIRVMKARHKI